MERKPGPPGAARPGRVESGVAGGLGVRCPECQADGVICPEVEVDCEECQRIGWSESGVDGVPSLSDW